MKLKNYAAALTAFFFCLVFVATMQKNVFAVQYEAGDVNGDGKVNLEDATLVLKNALGIISLEGESVLRADIDKDGKVDLNDATAVLKMALGIDATSQNPEVTGGKKEALKKAQSYLKILSFSYMELVEQLEFDKFTHEEAIYAADNCGADWNEQALKQAKSYLKILSFSYAELVDQLEFDKFTHEEVIYAVDNCGADWNEQAAKKAKLYLEISAFSREELIEMLEYEGFTHEQAVYGVQQNGL